MDLSALRRLLTYLVAGGLVLAVGVRLLEAPRPAASPVQLEPDAGSPAADAPAERIYVDVAGAVRRPGLYRLRAGARVGQAVERAGGRTRAAARVGVNLAARLEDGQQVVVSPKADAAGSRPTSNAPAAPEAPSEPAAPATRLNLATASADQIDAAAEGIGPTIAARIVEFRDQSGGLSSVEQLREVPGIGEARLEALTEVFAP